MSLLALSLLIAVTKGQGLALPTTTKTTSTPTLTKDNKLRQHRPGQRLVYLFFNPGAGKGDQQEELARILNLLEADDMISTQVIKTHPDKLHEQVRAVVEHIRQYTAATNNEDGCPKDQTPMVVASGGDGTISAVAQAVMNTGIPFGVIPRGTANAFATALGIPTTTIEEACQTIREGNTRFVDAATCHHNGNKITRQTKMVLLAGIGWEANMVMTAQGTLKRVLGKLSYIWGGIKETVAPKPFQCQLRINGGDMTKPIQTHSITVANVAPGGSVSAQGTGQVIPDDELLDITIQTCGDSTLESLNAMAHLLKAAVVKEPTETENIIQLRVREIEISCRTKQPVVIDGELQRHKQKMFHYKVLPKALNVITPPPETETETTTSMPPADLDLVSSAL